MPVFDVEKCRALLFSPRPGFGCHGRRRFPRSDDVNLVEIAQAVARVARDQHAVLHAQVTRNGLTGVRCRERGAKNLLRVLSQGPFGAHDSFNNARMASTATAGSSEIISMRPSARA